MSGSATLPPPDPQTIEALATGDLIVRVDAVRSDYDPCKLGPALLPVVTSRLDEARAAHSAASLAGGTASERLAEARKRLGGLLREGFAHLSAVPEEVAPSADVGQALDTYGWERRKIGDIGGPTRIENLVRTAVQVTPHLPPYLQYPPHVLIRMITWLGVIDACTTLASGGSFRKILQTRDEKRESLLKAISRVRHHYCTASDDGEMNPELTRIGLPLGTNGTIPSPTLPEPSIDCAYEPATGQITVPALPGRAKVLVAWRQANGGVAEIAGVSIGSAVGSSDFSPLLPRLAYEFWVTGRNAAGDGPPSRRVAFTA